MAYAGQTIENPVSGERITFTPDRRRHERRAARVRHDPLRRRSCARRPRAPEPGGALRDVSGTMKFHMNGKKIVAFPVTPSPSRPAPATSSPTAATCPSRSASRSAPR